MSKKILYISQNGVTTPIGRSQIAPYLLELSKLDHQIILISSEPAENSKLIRNYVSEFKKSYIEWTSVNYINKPPLLGQFITMLKLYSAAKDRIIKNNVKIIHCRSFPPALIGYLLKKRYKLKLIFDFRDFYADWGIDHTKGLRRLVYRFLKYLEKPMIKNSDKIVTLTEKAKNILGDKYRSGEDYDELFEVIPCCADFRHFNRNNYSVKEFKSLREKIGISDKSKVLLYLGSLGTDYLLPEKIRLFKELTSLHSESVFLFISNNGEELVHEECARQQVSLEKIRFLQVEREKVPLYISIADLSVIFIRADHTKAGCSPTKLAELLACGIPVVVNSGVGDLDNLISMSKNKSVLLRDFSSKAMRNALIKTLAITETDRQDIRVKNFEFDLNVGVGKYNKVYNSLSLKG